MATTMTSRMPIVRQPASAEDTLLALGDPHVRAVAERSGDPDELLRGDWVPDRNRAI